MSFFNFLKTKKPAKVSHNDKTMSSEAPIWETTVDPDVFFNSYQKAIHSLNTNDSQTAIELSSNLSDLQIAFIDRFAKTLLTKLKKEKNKDKRAEQAIEAINKVRVYNKQMTVDVRAHLAQTKKKLIGD